MLQLSRRGHSKLTLFGHYVYQLLNMSEYDQPAVFRLEICIFRGEPTILGRTKWVNLRLEDTTATARTKAARMVNTYLHAHDFVATINI